ncbi:MAG: glycosyl transferase family 2 [Acidobacteria bacterium]|nr:MAG: glycosyl transferase family 2 [Acidobacteriota bacterium]
MKASTTLSILVPVYNEEHLVCTSLERLKILGQSPLLDHIEVIVVDDGSSDQTGTALSEFQQSVVAAPPHKLEWLFLRHETNQGKAAAIHTALSQANAELTVIHDADLEYHPSDLLKMVKVFLEEQADAVFGSRFLASEYRRVLFFRHELGNRFLTLLCNLVSDLNLTDMETCYKMVRTDLMKSVPLVGQGFEIEPEISIKLAKRGARIFEVPIRYAGRTYQEGKKIKWKDGIRAIGAILRFGFSEASDINPLYLTYLENISRNRPYLHVGYTDGQSGETYPKEQEFDTVICLNVVEHLANDLGALRNIREALEQDGRAIILVPCGPWLMGTLDDALGHQRRYTQDQLRVLASRAGFHVDTMLEFNRVGVVAWWINGKLLRRRAFGFLQIKLLNVLTPVFRVLDKLLPLPPLSLIAVLSKPGLEAAGMPIHSSPAKIDVA